MDFETAFSAYGKEMREKFFAVQAKQMERVRKGYAPGSVLDTPIETFRMNALRHHLLEEILELLIEMEPDKQAKEAVDTGNMSFLVWWKAQSLVGAKKVASH